MNPEPILPPTPVTDQGGRYRIPEESIPWRLPMQPPQLPQPGYQPQPSGQRPPEKQVIASNPLNPFNANLKGFIQDWLNQPGKMGSELWNSYSSAAGGLGTGAPAGAFKSALPAMGKIGQVLAQMGQMPKNPFGKVASNIVSNPDHPFATEMKWRLPGVYKYLEKVPEKIKFNFMPRAETLQQGPVGLTRPFNRATNEIEMLKSHPRDFADFYKSVKGTLPEAAMEELKTDYNKIGLHEIQHVLDMLKNRRLPSPYPLGGFRGGNRQAELAGRVKNAMPDLKTWADATEPLYQQIYGPLAQAPSHSIHNETLVDAAARGLQALEARRRSR